MIYRERTHSWRRLSGASLPTQGLRRYAGCDLKSLRALHLTAMTFVTDTDPDSSRAREPDDAGSPVPPCGAAGRARFGAADAEDRSANAMYAGLMTFLGIDDTCRANARKAWEIVDPKLDGVIADFYASVRGSEVGPLVGHEIIERLKRKQREHWTRLFTSDFDVTYANSVRRIGIQHRDVGLDPKWFIASYVRLKAEFTNIIVHEDIPVAQKGHLIRALDRYVAIDMGLALSTYLAAIVD
ncbi:MAG: hypothetical protein BroJett029_32490 [Alphaproteobacteria bacterium]|nr:MAG: hypothetical protein BroJett029_32490 [Alphaproteobacteria bacterium]